MNLLFLVLAIVAGSLIVGGSVFFFLRARFRESIETIPTNVASGAAPNAVAAEVRAIGEQITRAMSEQQHQGETQRQLLTQKLDGVRQTVDAQRAHVEGLRNELRHEVRRRDAEMEDLRHQIGTIQTTVGLPAASMRALPPAPLAAPLEEPLADEPPALAEPAAESTPAFDDVPAFDNPPAFGDAPAFDDDLFGDSAPGTPYVDVAHADPAQPPTDSSAPDPFAALVFESDVLDGEADAGTAFEYWTPDAPDDAPDAPAEPEAPGYDVTFEDVSDSLDALETDPEPEIAHDTDRQPAGDWEEASFDAPSASPAAHPASSGSMFDDVDLSDSIFQSVALPPSPDAQRPSASHPGEATERTRDDSATDVEVEPAASLSGNIHWVARPRGSDPSRLSSLPDLSLSDLDDAASPLGDAQDDDPVTASADDFFSASASGGGAETDDLDAFDEADAPGLIDLNTLVSPAQAPEPTAPLAAPVADLTPVPYPMAPADSAPSEAPSVPADDDRQPGTAPTPNGADDLTVITSITDDIQRLLHLEGVTTLEEIAQWGRTRARYIAVRVEVSEETIMNQWVFEAQAAMFNHFSARAGI